MIEYEITTQGECPKISKTKSITISYQSLENKPNKHFDRKTAFYCDILGDYDCEFSGESHSDCPIFKSAPGYF